MLDSEEIREFKYCFAYFIADHKMVKLSFM